MDERLPRRRALVAPAHAVYRHEMLMRHGWDGEVGRHFLVRRRRRRSSASRGGLHQRPRQPRPGLARAARSTPTQRRRGYGTAAMRAGRRRRPVRWAGPRSAGSAGTGERTRGFAAALRLRAEVGRGLPPSAPARAGSGPGRPAVRRGGCRTPATTSCCASSAATPDELLPGARRGAPRPSTTRRSTTSTWRTRSSPPTACAAYETRPARQRLPVLPRHRPASRYRRDRRPDGR